MIRTPVTEDTADAPRVVQIYKNLKYVERDFKHIKVGDLDMRPVFHRLGRVESHMLICMLACYLTWHLRGAFAPLTFTDQHPTPPDNPVAPARRSAATQAKTSAQHDPAGQPYPRFRDLLGHLATLSRQPSSTTAPSQNRENYSPSRPTPAARLRTPRSPVPLPLT